MHACLSWMVSVHLVVNSSIFQEKVRRKRERAERERERERERTERSRARERVCVCVSERETDRGWREKEIDRET